ncbi:NADAR family protein [Neptunicoccus sediminis]|uniref:NADAR family protein n=1 Tax=Neptunicoccus sediminis TaxID=1892596 RepID=UPI0008461171|nr:NADAR family protein [Neptunicoccus sediminis]
MNDVRFHGASGRYGFLSNFSAYGFRVDEVFWPTVEHYYQASKFETPDKKQEILNCETPRLAKKLGGQVDGIRNDWLEERVSVMRFAVLKKFQQNDDIARSLCEITGQIFEISEDDCFWGVGAEGTGENMLGKILMGVREQVCEA